MKRREFITLIGGAAVVVAAGGERAAIDDAGNRISVQWIRPRPSPH